MKLLKAVPAITPQNETYVPCRATVPFQAPQSISEGVLKSAVPVAAEQTQEV